MADSAAPSTDGPTAESDGEPAPGDNHLRQPAAVDWFDQRAVSIADGLGVSVAELSRVVVGPDAGPESGEVYYLVEFAELGVAVRQDAMSACLTWLSPAVETSESATAMLHRHRLIAGAIADLGPVSRSPGSGCWTPAAVGQTPLSGTSDRIEFSRPGQPGKQLAFETLNLLSASLQRLLRATTLDASALEEVRAVAVAPGAVIGTSNTSDAGRNGTDVFGRTAPPPIAGPDFSIRAGTGVMVSDRGEYLATRCGYILLDAGLLSVLPPFWIDPEEMEVRWLALDSEPSVIGPDAVLQALTDLGIVHGIRIEEIGRVAELLRDSPGTTGAFLVAAGTPAAAPEQTEILVDTRRGSGRTRPDGSIDFLGVDVVPTVKVGHLLARRKGPDQAAPATVKGQSPRELQPPERLRAGANVTLRRVEDGEEFVARIDGIPMVGGGEIAVTPLLVLDGDVCFNTGNLDFEGEVLIKGSVRSGFSVKARRNITVTGKVESGGCLESEGNITVSGGIYGRRTSVTAAGNIRAQTVVDARVSAGGDLVLAAGALNARLRAGENLTMERGSEAGIVGGQVWVGRSIHLANAGAPEGVPTTLVVGLEPEQADSLDQIKQNIGMVHSHTLRLLKKFALARIDLEQIRNMISAARGPKRRILIRYATQLGQLAALHRKFAGQRQKLEHSIGTAVDEVEILLTGQAYPGVQVRIGGCEHVVIEGRKGARFFVAEGEILVE